MIILRGFKKTVEKMVYITLCGLFVMMLFMTVDVILQITTRSPILGNFEIVQIMMVVIVYFAVGYTQIKGKHIAVDLVKSHLPVLGEKIVDVIINVICIAAGVIMVRAAWINVIDVWGDGATTSSLHIPLFPFYGVVCFGCAILLLTLCVTFIERIYVIIKGKELFTEAVTGTEAL